MVVHSVGVHRAVLEPSPLARRQGVPAALSPSVPEKHWHDKAARTELPSSVLSMYMEAEVLSLVVVL